MVSAGPDSPARRNAADPPSGVRTTYTAPWCPATSQRYAASSFGTPAPASRILVPASGVAETRSACITSAAPGRRPSCVIADTRHAASPVACGAAMLVPPLISSPVFQRGTEE